MFIKLTEQQEKRIMQDVKAIEDITKYASKIADSLPAYVEPKVLTYAEKLKVPCSCHICESKRLVDLAAYEKTMVK
jgi:predicted Zn-ribbon and HTH transcriptional regulator